MSTEARDFCNWLDGWIEGRKKLNEKEIARLLEKLAPLRKVAMSAPVVPSLAGTVKAIPGDPATDPRFTPETMPKKVLSNGAAMDAGVPKK